MSVRPVGDFFNPFRGPLTAEDIEYIDQTINLLISDLFKDQPFNDQEEALTEELQKSLPHKIHWYLEIVGHVEQDPDAEVSPLFGERLRALLKMVNEYYYKLN